MIESYLNQFIELEVQRDYDVYGESTHALTETFRGRLQPVEGRINNDGVIDIPFDSILYTQTCLKVEDKIIYEKVIYKVVKVRDQRNTDGSKLFYKVWLYEDGQK